jgi:transposase
MPRAPKRETGARADNHAEPYRKETTRDDRIRVVAFKEAGKTWAEIADLTRIPARTCRSIWRRYQEDGDPSNRKRTGRPKILSERIDEVIRFVTSNRRTRRLQWEEIIREMNLSCGVRTLRTAMAERGYHKRVPRKKFPVRPANQPKRVAWCREHQSWTREDWLRVMWVDESSFSTSGFHHRPMVIRNADEEYVDDLVDYVYHSGRQSKMAWGAFCGDVKSDLIFIPGKAKLNSQAYVDMVMEPALIPFYRQLEESGVSPLVAEDNAPGHRGHALDCRDRHNISALQWPAQSPDLNLIEAVWQEMENYLGPHYERVGTTVELEQVCQEAWAAVSGERLLRLIDSMPQRLQAVIDAEGKATPY